MSNIQSDNQQVIGNSFNKKSLIGWCLFDFANSIPAIIGGVYFSKWFVEDIHGSYVNLNILFFVSSIIIVLTGKYIGNYIDKQGYIKWIIASSFLSVLITFLIYFNSKLTPSNIIIIVSFILYILFIFGYQLSRICHNVYLRVVIPEHLQPRMSGFGAASNWAGSITGLVLTIPLIVYFPGVIGREMTFLLAAILYCVLTPLALYLMFKSTSQPLSIQVQDSKYIRNWRSIISNYGMILLVYFLLFETMATIQRNLPPYLSIVFNMSDDVQSYAFLLILVLALLGGLLSAKKLNSGNSRLWTIIGSSLLVLAILFITIDFMPLIWSGFIIAGLSYGILESSMRVNFMNRFTASKAGVNFGVMTAVERTSGVLGPLIWIAPSIIYYSDKTANIAAMLLMAILTLLALFLFLILKEKKNNHAN